MKYSTHILRGPWLGWKPGWGCTLHRALACKAISQRSLAFDTNKVCRGISAQLRPSVRNQIYLVKLIPTQLTQASFLQKNKMWQNIFLDIFNAEIAQCRRKLDVILGTKVVQFWSYQKWFFLNVVLTWYLSMKNWLWMSRFHDFWHHCAISALQI